MAAPRAPRGRRWRDGSLGQIPLSSGEIELYSRQDEVARRRRRLLAVRDQERRLAQQVTQRYRKNLQKLQQTKSKKSQKQLTIEQQKMLTELHVRHQTSLQNMGTAQRNARLKLLELLETAYDEQEKWIYNQKIAGKQRAMEAKVAQEQEEAIRIERRRWVEQNMARLKLLSGQQRQQAKARARREQEVAMQRAKDREELEKLRRMQSPEETFVTPRPHKDDEISYRFTRTHCLAITSPSTKERPAVTVIRHNRKHPMALRGGEEAKKYSEEMDMKREKERLIVEEQQEMAKERGENALENVVSRREGQQALEWLALVDKMERRVRAQGFGDGEEDVLGGEGVEGVDDPERMAERTFARMLEMDEYSVELSAFSIETDDDRSVGLADTDHEQSDGDKVAQAGLDDKVKFKGFGRGDLMNSPDEINADRSRKGVTSDRGDTTPGKLEQPMKATFFGDLERKELENLNKAKSTRDRNLVSEGAEVPLKPTGRPGREDQPGKSGKREASDYSSNMSPDAPNVQWNKHADRGDNRYIYDNASERPEGTDSEGDEMDPASHLLGPDNDSMELLENRLQEVLDLRFSKSRRDTSRPPKTSRESLSSESEGDSLGSQLDDITEGLSRRSGVSQRLHGPTNGSDKAGLSAATNAPVSPSERGLSPLSLLATSGIASSGEHHGMPAMSASLVGHGDVSPQLGRFYGSVHGSRSSNWSVAAMGREEVANERRTRKRGSSSSYPGEEHGARMQMRSDGKTDAESKVAIKQRVVTDNRLGSSAASSRSSYRFEDYGEEHEVGRLERDACAMETRSGDTVAPERKSGSPIPDSGGGGKASPGTDDHIGGRLSREFVQEETTENVELNHFSTSGRAQPSVSQRDTNLSPSSVTSHDEGFHEKESFQDDKNSRVPSIDEDERPLFESSFAPSQKSLSRLDQVVNERARSLEQRFIDQHMISFSSSEHRSEDEGGAETEVHRPSIGTHLSANINLDDPYRQQINHQARRRSTSAVSIAQYSLPPSDTRSSFDDSLDQLGPGYGDDSFMNELVPMFPKGAFPPPPRLLEEDSRAVEEYDVQLVAPNMSRMLTTERRTSFGRSRQRLVHHEPQASATNPPRRQSVTSTARHAEDTDGPSRTDERAISSMSRRSSSGSSDSEVARSIDDTSVDQLPFRQRSQIKQSRSVSTVAAGGNSQARTAERREFDDRSDISSDSGVSSLGFAVQLNFAAGTTRRRNDGGRQEAAGRHTSQQNKGAKTNVSDDELDNHSIASERSFASSSSMSMDAHFNYLVNMTSAVGKSLPLHLRLPAMIYGKKDMTKPPAPVAWSASSVSSIASASEGDPDEASEREPQPARTVPRANSSMIDSLPEEQHTPPPRTQHRMDQQAHGSDLQPAPISYLDDASDACSDSGNTGDDQARRATRVTFNTIKEKVAKLPPPPRGSANMSQPPPPMQTFSRSLGDSASSSDQHSSDTRSAVTKRIPPPPLGSLNMSKPPPPMQNFERSLEGSQSSPERHFDRRRSSEKHNAANLRRYEAEEERKQGDSSSDSDTSSHNNESFSSSSASSRRQSVKKAEKLVIPVKKSRDNNNKDSDRKQGEKEISLADAFRRRHPGFGHRVESHRDKLKRQRDKQRDEQQQEQSKPSSAVKRDAAPESSRDRTETDSLPPEKQELLNRLASGSRAKISNREMKERSRRLYHQLPEVVERKRQEEVMRRRRERLNELREQEKERRLQQKQRRQQQQQQRH